MDDGARIIHDVQLRALSASALLGTMRRVMKEGSWAAELMLKSETEKRLKAVKSGGKGLLDAFGIPHLDMAEADLATFAAKSARDDVESAFALLTASELIFYHSLVDEAAWDCCRAIAVLSPGALDGAIGQRKVAFSELASVGVEGVRGRLISETVTQMKKEGLIDKVAFIMRTCRGRKPTGPEGYHFKGRRLKRLDRMRHELVHGLKVEALGDIEDGDLTFLSLTPVYLAQVVAAFHEVHVDVDYSKPRMLEMLASVSKRARVSGKW